MLSAVLFSTSETGKDMESTRVYKYASRTCCGLRYRWFVRWVLLARAASAGGNLELDWWREPAALLDGAVSDRFLGQDVKKFKVIDVDSKFPTVVDTDSLGLQYVERSLGVSYPRRDWDRPYFVDTN
jgi:hypothetical protein